MKEQVFEMKTESPIFIGGHESQLPLATHRCMRLLGHVAALASLGLALAACDSAPEEEPEPTQVGELQRGEFRYACAGSNDAFCVEFQASHFPDRFAIGGQFSVSYNPRDTNGPLPWVDTAAPALLGLEQGRFVFERPGTSALLAVRSNEEMVDFLHITGERVQGFFFSDEDGGGGLLSVELEVDTTRQMTAQPRGEFGQVLAGSLSYAWSSEDPSIASVVTDPTSRTVTVRAESLGETRLVVEAAGTTEFLPVVVSLQPPDPTTTAGDTDTDTDTDGDTDTDTTGPMGDTDTDTDTDTDGDTDTDTTTGAGR